MGGTIRAIVPNAQPRRHGKLLVVDDEQAIVDVVAQYFTGHGLEVASCALSPGMTQRALAQEGPDLRRGHLSG